jgi:hypothetical protein
MTGTQGRAMAKTGLFWGLFFIVVVFRGRYQVGG